MRNITKWFAILIDNRLSGETENVDIMLQANSINDAGYDIADALQKKDWNNLIQLCVNAATTLLIIAGYAWTERSDNER